VRGEEVRGRVLEIGVCGNLNVEARPATMSRICEMEARRSLAHNDAEAPPDAR